MLVNEKKLFELEKEFKNLQKGSILIISTSAENYFEVYLFILEVVLSKLKSECICTTINRSADNLAAILENKNIDIKNIYFIDCLSKTAGIEKPMDRCEYASHPESLEEINMYINEYIDELHGNNKFLFFDSISTLLIYNDSKTVLQFINFLAHRARAFNTKGVFMLTKKELDPKFVSQMIQFCDKFMEL